MADNTIANAIKFLKGEEGSLPATKTEGQVYFAYKNVGTAEKPSYTGAIYIDTPIGGTQTRVKMTANADIADKAFNDSAGLSIRDTYLSSLGYTDDGKQTILIKGSGNNQTKIALPIASATKSGIVTTDAQSFGGTKTFVTINSNSLTVTGSGSFNYSGIGSGTADAVRPVWFSDNSANGKPVVNTNFTYNPATQTLKIANLSGTAEKATSDGNGQNIRNTYIKDITINNNAMTITKGSGATSTLSVRDKLYSGNVITTKDDLDKFIETNVFKFGHINAIEGYNGLEKNDGIVLSASWKNNTNYGHQIFIDDSSYNLRHRYKNSTWSDWASILDSTNYNSYAPTKTGGGASGTWGISISGNAATASKATNDDGGQNIRSTYVKYKTIKFSAVADKVYLLESNGVGSSTNTTAGDSNISTAIIPAATDKAAGVITTGTQTFSGEKKFNNTIFVNDCLAGNPMTGTSITKLVLLSIPNANIGDTSYTSSVYFKALLKWICSNYPNKANHTFIGRVSPNSQAYASIYIYDTSKIDATSGLPEYSSGSYVQISGNIYTFGTYNYAFYFREALMNDSKYAGSASSGGAATSANKLNTNAGSATLPVYFSGGIPVACSTNLGVSITGNAASASKLTSNAGSVTQPIYFKDGKPVATTYSLDATVKAGVPNRLAFYSGANEISNASNLKYYTATNTKGANQTILHILGTTYGNDANTMIGGKASSLNWNDGGPQIRFSSSETSSENGALIFTNHDSSGIGASFHFVSDQGDWSVNSKRFVARTSVIIGQEALTLNNQGYNLYVNGTEYINGILTAVGDCQFIAHGNEFNFVPTLKAASGIWFNYRQTGGQPADSSYTIDSYTFGNGANKGLATITDGLFSGAATYVRDSNNKTSNISITYSKAAQTSTSWLASWNGYELGTISPANITAGKATKIATAKTITLSGAVTGSVSFDGSANVTLTTTVNHSHSQYYDSTQSRIANTVLAAPSGSAGAATFRKLVAADIPTLTKSKISDFPTSMPASDVSAWAKASTKPSYSWGEITGKPSTFTPSDHKHSYLVEIYSATEVPTRPSDGRVAFYYNVNMGLENNMPCSNNANAILSLSRHAGDYSSQLGFSSNGNVYYRAGDRQTSWKTMLDSSNYTSYTVTKDGSGASGTWGISVSGSSASCTGNAATATKLQTARTISLTGSVTGSGTFDGSGNLSITTTTNHSHGQYLPLAGGKMTGNITYDAKGTCYIGAGANDAVNMVGGALNNLVISSWNGISFSTVCSSTFVNKSAVSIDCRNGILAAASLRVGNGSGSTINFCTNGGTAVPGAKIVAYNDRIEFVFA